MGKEGTFCGYQVFTEIMYLMDSMEASQQDVCRPGTAAVIITVIIH